MSRGEIRIKTEELFSKPRHPRQSQFNAGCRCQFCKGLKGAKFYEPRGSTYKQQIENSLKGIDYEMFDDGDYTVYRWGGSFLNK